MKFARFAFTFMAALWLAPALAATSAPTIKVESAWARSTPPGAKTAAAYFTIVNTGNEADRLIGASTPIAGMAGAHRTIDDNGVMKMRSAGAIDVKPGSPVKFGPGGLHLMMMDLKQPLNDGQTFPLTLDFEKAGKVEVTVHVQRTAPHGAPAGMGKMDMPPASRMPMNMGH